MIVFINNFLICKLNTYMSFEKRRVPSCKHINFHHTLLPSCILCNLGNTMTDSQVHSNVFVSYT
jgi:hypothetical protein